MCTSLPACQFEKICPPACIVCGFVCQYVLTINLSTCVYYPGIYLPAGYLSLPACIELSFVCMRVLYVNLHCVLRALVSKHSDRLTDSLTVT